MKKTKKLLTKTMKCLFVFCTIFSQMSFPLSVLAEEVLENNELNKVVELENETTGTNNGDTTEGTDQIATTKNETENNATEDNTDEKNTQTEENNTTTEEKKTTEENNTTSEEEKETTEENNTTSEEEKETTEENNSENTDEDNTTEDETTTPEEIAVFTTEKVTQETNNFYIIKNTSDVAVTVQQLKKLETNAVITDEEGNSITEDNEIIISNYQIVITNEDDEEVLYTIIVLADYDNNGIVDTEDQTILLNQLKATTEESDENIIETDLNKDEVFNILDVTYPIFTEKTWENNKETTDSLTHKLISNSEEVVIGEEIQLNYNITGFTTDTLAGIQGTLKYNKNLLELTKIEVDGIEENITELESGNFAYLLADYNENGTLITLTFKALATDTEETVVSIEGIITSIGGVSANLSSSSVSTSFGISAGKGGDVEEEITETTTTTTSTETTTTSAVTTTSVVVPTTTTKYVALSGDCYIKSLIIDGYDIDFDKNTYEYSITVKSDVSSLDLTVLLNSATATYTVEGNSDFKTGENIVNIIVTAENGATKTYTIKVTKEKEKTVKEKDTDEEEEETEENSASKTIIIILIILVIIGLIYVIFKDDEEDEKESNKNNKTNKKESKK